MNQKALLDAAGRRLVVEKLSKLKRVRQFDREGEPQAETLGHALSDIEEAMLEVLAEHLPALQSAETDQAVEDALDDIGDSLRHILYHINDTRYFAYLKE